MKAGSQPLNEERRRNVNISLMSDQMTCVPRTCSARSHLCLGVPCEVEAVGLSGHRHVEGKRVMVHHIVSHVVQLCVEACVRRKNRFYFGENLIQCRR